MTPKPNLDVTGAGPFVNIGRSDQTLTNASAHVAWSVALPALGFAVGGREGLRQATWGWIAYSVLAEGFFHAPDQPDPNYASEVRTDLITKLTLPLAVLLVDKLLGRPPSTEREPPPPIQDRRLQDDRRIQDALSASGAGPGGSAGFGGALPPLRLGSYRALPPQQQGPAALEVQLMPSSSTSNTSVALGGITPPAPRAP